MHTFAFFSACDRVCKLIFFDGAVKAGEQHPGG